jgi:hypothetical protein
MRRANRLGRTRRAACAATLVVGTLTFASTQCRADESAVAIGPIGGSLYLDPHLADYRWDTRGQGLWGVAGVTKLGPFGTGLRVWRATTTQSSGIPGETVVPQVKLTVTEATGEYRVAQIRGLRLLTSASAGLLHVGYAPDQLELATSGPGGSVTVPFDPLTEWIVGGGVTLRHSLFRGFDLGFGVERSWFRLDTAHRVGDEIVNDRETFGNWSARFELSHRIFRL